MAQTAGHFSSSSSTASASVAGGPTGALLGGLQLFDHDMRSATSAVASRVLEPNWRRDHRAATKSSVLAQRQGSRRHRGRASMTLRASR